MYSLKKIEVPEWQELKKHALNWKIGTILEHKEIAKLIYVEACSQKYYNVMIKAIKELTNIGIRLKSIRGVGYKVITPNEWLEEARKRISKGSQNFKEAETIINNAPYTLMDKDVRDKCLELHDLIIKQKYLLTGGIVSIHTLDKNKMQIREGNRI